MKGNYWFLISFITVKQFHWKTFPEIGQYFTVWTLRSAITWTSSSDSTFWVFITAIKDHMICVNNDTFERNSFFKQYFCFKIKFLQWFTWILHHFPLYFIFLFIFFWARFQLNILLLRSWYVFGVFRLRFLVISVVF